MASVDNANNPNDPNNPDNVLANVNQPSAQDVSQPATTSGAGGVTATGSGNVTGQTVGTANPSQPFQNISSYLSANAQGGQKLAGQVAGTVSAPISDASTGITNAANQFTQSVNAGYTPENKALTEAVSKNPAYVVAENPENVTNFQKQLNNRYAGPTDFTQTAGYGDLQAKIAGAQKAANNTQNESGIQQLLQSVEGPTTAGVNKLDSLLLSADPANYKTIQDAGAGASNLLPTLNQTTAEQNALAATGSTSASTSAAAAAKALQDALSKTSGNLSDEQKSIEQIVNSYNNSVGVINPVTQSIAQSIQDFLAANPQLSLSDSTNALAPLMNLKNIDMPDQSTYASKLDYQTVAALAQLGIDPSALAGLPISADKANLAQTFQLPPELQNAIGQAPGVQKALSGQLDSLGSQINSAVAPFLAAQDAYGKGAQLVKDLDAKIAALNQQAKDIQAQGAQGTPEGQAQIEALNAQLTDLQNQRYAQDSQNTNSWSTMQALAPTLQWVNQAAPGYNDLIAAINGQLGKLGSVGVPSLSYDSNTVTDPVSGVQMGAPIGKEVGNAAGLATGIGATGAGAATGLSAAEAAAAGVPGAFGEGLATSGAEGAVEAAQIGQGLSSGLQAAGPAALAAYGASNVIQNSMKNPIQSGIMTLANTGLSLATLSLPPQIFASIGSAIKNVMNSIGDFFGGLF